MNPLVASQIRFHALRYARNNLGYGETEGNNRGKFIRALGGIDGQEWCGVFVRYCYRMAYEHIGIPNPAWTYRRKGVLEPGAKALTKALGRVGDIWEPGEEIVQPGDLVCWERGLLGWQGHVGIVVDADWGDEITYIAGNEGKSGTVAVHTSKKPAWRFAGLR